MPATARLTIGQYDSRRLNAIMVSRLGCAAKQPTGGKDIMEQLDVNKLRDMFNHASQFVRMVTLFSPT